MTKLKKLFLIDGIGALVSAISLGVVLVQLEEYFGIPVSALYILAALPCLFALYDFYCYFKLKENLGSYLKGIAIVNLLYCALSIGFAFYHQSSITWLGWTYIVLEISIVATLALIELKATRNQR